MATKQRREVAVKADLTSDIDRFVEPLTQKGGEWATFVVDAQLTCLDVCWASKEAFGSGVREAWNEIIRSSNSLTRESVGKLGKSGSPYLLVCVCMPRWDTTNQDFLKLLKLAAKNFLNGGSPTEDYPVGQKPGLYSRVLRTEAELDKAIKEVQCRHVNERVQLGPAKSGESPDAQRERLEREIEAFHAQITERLHAWLAELEGKTFESKDDALKIIHEVTGLVRRAGRRLIYERQPVTLAAICGSRQKRPTIEVRFRSNGKQVAARSSVFWPHLTTIAA